MLRTALLSLIVLISLSSATLLRKSISRRQSEQRCQAIEGFDCTCSPYRVHCTTDRDLPHSLNVLSQEQNKYPSVELTINGERNHNINEHTFEPVKQLFKSDGDNLEFRIKFERFKGLTLPASAFNKVFPDNAPSTARKHLAVQIYNQEVQPNDNVNLFANLNVDSLELSVLYPFRGTFQQLFNGANIKYLRLSGVDIRSDLSQPFTGNIGRLEIAKQANQLTAQHFPIYPAHELILDAFYVTDFNSANPPNYSNLGELRVYSQERVPANAFRNFPNLHTLSITSEKGIDPHAFDGLNKLEKLTIKDTKPSLELLNSLPNLKEFEVNLDKFDEREQCQLVEKLANGQIAIQAIPGGQCSCASAYLDAASGRYACDADNCGQSSCTAIRNSYQADARTFNAPPAIRRMDGTDALRQREQKVYDRPYQVSREDQDKLQQAASSQGQEQTQTHSGDGGHGQGQSEHHYHPDPNQGEGSETAEGTEQREGDGNENRQDGEGNENRQEGDGHGHGHAHHTTDPNQSIDSTDAANIDGTEGSPATKRKLGWLPIALIIAAVAGLLLIGIIILVMRRRRNAAGYNAAATSEHAQTARA